MLATARQFSHVGNTRRTLLSPNLRFVSTLIPDDNRRGLTNTLIPSDTRRDLANALIPDHSRGSPVDVVVPGNNRLTVDNRVVQRSVHVPRVANRATLRSGSHILVRNRGTRLSYVAFTDRRLTRPVALLRTFLIPGEYVVRIDRHRPTNQLRPSGHLVLSSNLVLTAALVLGGKRLALGATCATIGSSRVVPMDNNRLPSGPVGTLLIPSKHRGRISSPHLRIRPSLVSFNE